MYGTYICMPQPAPSALDALDDALVGVRRVMQRPGYRRRLLADLDGQLELGTLRTLRAVERYGATGPCVGDIAETLAVDPSTASRTVDRCVSAGLLARTASESDRRRTRLTLTDEGRAVLSRVTDARREALAEVTQDWTEADLLRLTALLGTLRAGFDRLEATDGR
jgi:DNA-binding MarR family transcriptional regulator